MSFFFVYEIGYTTATIAFDDSYSDIHMSHKVTEYWVDACEATAFLRQC